MAGARMSEKDAKVVIADLLAVAHDGALASCQDGGVNVDIVFSRKPGREDRVMTLRESEQRLDAAIRRAYAAMTGEKVKGDPVEFVNGPV